MADLPPAGAFLKAFLGAPAADEAPGGDGEADDDMAVDERQALDDFLDEIAAEFPQTPP